MTPTTERQNLGLTLWFAVVSDLLPARLDIRTKNGIRAFSPGHFPRTYNFLYFLLVCILLVSALLRNKLIIIQKRAVRNICKLKYLTHTAPYFKNLHVLTIFDGTLQVSQFMFKVTFNLLPSSLVTYFQINSAVHSYNTRHLQDDHISSVRTAKRLKTLRHSGLRIWNSLPSKIKAINNFHSFTKSVKSSLLDAYPVCMICLFFFCCISFLLRN